MYNFSSKDNIPLHLPVALSTCLRTWFTKPVLDKGLQLLQKGRLSRFFFHRNVSGGLFKDYQLRIVFHKTDRIQQGFTLQSEHCEFCGYSRRTDRCEHIAALCILSICEAEPSRYYPVPLHYKNSRWGKLGSFLGDWLGGEKGEYHQSIHEGILTLKRETLEGSLEASVPLSATKVWEIFFQQASEPENDPASQLYRDIQDHCLTHGERELMVAGSSSKAMARDSSKWNRLCAFFFGIAGSKVPTAEFDSTSKRFVISFRDPDSGSCLNIFLPKNRTREIFRQLAIREFEPEGLTRASQGFRVSLGANGFIEVTPTLCLDKRQTFALDEISENRFGNSYFFFDEGFIHPDELDPAAKVVAPQSTPATTPLFDFTKNSQGFRVNTEDIDVFLTTNREALQHPDNEVASEILSLRTATLPDSLVILEFDEDHDWFYLSCDYKIGVHSVSLDELISGNADNLFVGTTALKLKEGPLSWFHNLAAKRTWIDSTGRKGVKLSRAEFLSFVTTFQEVQNSLPETSFKERLAKILDLNSWSDKKKLPSIPNHLRSYQKNGFAWLYHLYEMGLGGILADDMGLGKTHQALALLQIIVNRSEDSKSLVICPTSVLMHWVDKIERFYPDLPYCTYYGSGRNLSSGLKHKLLLTTYGTARNDRDVLADSSFDVIILDEIQTLKNRKTTIYKTVDTLSARVKFGLSGTPIENSLEDLHSLFTICLPGFLGGSKRFKKTFLNPITQYRNQDRKKLLLRQIKPFILRRSRTQVLLELPDLIEDYRSCMLSDEQVFLYQQILGDHQPLLDDLAEESTKINYINILAMITKLKQVCNHPCLLEKSSDPYKYQSGKWDLFVELLAECLDSRRKVVVFSQYTGMLDIIATYLNDVGVGFAELRGGMNIQQRTSEIEKFTNDKDCNIFCSSLLAGGSGIDLLAGQVVIHYDRWWNPAKEAQATARVHRMGQKDVVQLFLLITKGTLEEKINNIISKKLQLSSSIIQDDEAGLIKQLDRQQLAELFRIS